MTNKTKFVCLSKPGKLSLCVFEKSNHRN